MLLMSHTCLGACFPPHLPSPGFSSNAVSTSSMWASGHTFKNFYLLKYLIAWPGFGWGLGLPWCAWTRSHPAEARGWTLGVTRHWPGGRCSSRPRG